MGKRKILVTSALPYANGPLHLGHLAGAYVPADIYVRYQRLKGHDVLFICGTDEHGVPITLTAEREGVSPREIVDRYHENIRDSFEKIGISFDNFSGTARPVHHQTSQDFFLRLHEKGFLEEREVPQLECPQCRRALPDRFVEGTCPSCKSDGARGDQCETCGKWLEPSALIEPKCKMCGTPPVLISTRHWFFKLKSMQHRLEAWVTDHPSWRENVKNFCTGWFKTGLEDRPITRDISWGVPVPLPGAEGKVLYVWFDAPIGYISSTKEWAERQGRPDRWKDYWLDPETELIHFIGKDNIVFHAIVFPAMLMAHDEFVLPSEIPANEFLNLEGRPLSTSRNWAVWVPEYLDIFPPDLLRYTIARNAPETRDTDFTWKDFQAKSNDELADILGNLINRSLSFCRRFFDGRVPALGELKSPDERIRRTIRETAGLVGNHLEAFAVRDALGKLMLAARGGNRYFDEKQPWATRKSDPADCATTLNLSLQLVKVLGAVMHPFLPVSAEKTWRMLGLEGKIEETSWDEIGSEQLREGHPIGELEILFAKIDDEVIEKQIEKLTLARAASESPAESESDSETTPPDTTSPEVSYDEFSRMETRIGEILSAERIEGKDGLVRATVDVSHKTLSVILESDVAPQDILGRHVVVVTNLRPRIRGLASEGLILSARGPGGTILFQPGEKVEKGSRVQ